MNSATDNRTGAIDAVAAVKTLDQLTALGKTVGDFRHISPKTLRRFARKAAARFTEFNSATK